MEQSQICVMNTGLAKQERGDPCWHDNLTHCSSQLCWWQDLPSSTEVPAQEGLLQQYEERVERLSQRNRVIKFCTDEGFLSTVEVGQFFMTEDTEEFSQFTESVGCRENILPRDENHLTRKFGFEWIPKLGLCWKSQSATCKNEYGVEIRIESVNEETSHSWVRISHGLKKFVTDLIDKEHDDNEQETSEMQSDELALKTNVLAFASRSKAKEKPRRRTSVCSSTRIVPTFERSCTHVEPGTYSHIVFPWTKRLRTLRHGHLPREEEGAIEFWRIKDCLRYLRTLCIGLMESGRVQWQEVEDTRKENKKVLTRQVKTFLTSELFKVIQDAIPLILHYRIMC